MTKRKWYQTATGIVFAVGGGAAVFQWLGFSELRVLGAMAVGTIFALASFVDNQQKEVDALRRRINRLDGIDGDE